jgi:hypothetical protein
MLSTQWDISIKPYVTGAVPRIKPDHPSSIFPSRCLWRRRVSTRTLKKVRAITLTRESSCIIEHAEGELGFVGPRKLDEDEATLSLLGRRKILTKEGGNGE